MAIKLSLTTSTELIRRSMHHAWANLGQFYWGGEKGQQRTIIHSEVGTVEPL